MKEKDGESVLHATLKAFPGTELSIVRHLNKHYFERKDRFRGKILGFKK